jgi:hypothetical protein
MKMKQNISLLQHPYPYTHILLYSYTTILIKNFTNNNEC